MIKNKAVTIEQVDRFAACLTELASACHRTTEKLRAQGMDGASSTNFKSAVERGLDLTLKFVSGVAGSAETAPAEAIYRLLLNDVLVDTSRPRDD